MKKLSFYIAVIILASLTSFSIDKKYEHPDKPSGPMLTDSTLIVLEPLAEDLLYPAVEYTVCTSEACLLATLPEVLPEAQIVPGEAYTVCTSEDCFLTVISEIQYDAGMPLLIVEYKSHQMMP